MHIAFLGLGQIGGSVARAAMADGFATRVTAWTPRGTGPAAAVGEGIEAAASAEDAIRGAGLVVLAAPPLTCLELLDALGGPLADALGRESVVTDVASTKRRIVDRATELGLRFVGGHPMAGREASGYGAADPDLFRDRPWVVIPREPADELADDRVRELAVACGARPVTMTAADHDDAVAAISHVPLLVSAALVEAAAGDPHWPLASRLAAGGWASMTRLALGDPAMGAGILATNATAAANQLRALRARLDEWLALLVEAEPDPAVLAARLAEARRRATTPVDG